MNDKYYSLFKVEKDREKTLSLCALLFTRGSEVVVTHIPKGNAIWVWEPDAVPLSTAPTAKKQSSLPSPLNAPFPYRVLESHSQYDACYIRVPDLDMCLAAIRVDGIHYALFKLVEDRAKAMELATKLLRGGDEIVITKVEQGYGVWVLEPDAYLFLGN